MNTPSALEKFRRLPWQCLSGAQLKWIAMISMVIDHANKGIIFGYIILRKVDNPVLTAISDIFAILGRIAFPIFLFLLVEGFFHTRSKLKYFLYMLIFGIISEVPYDMFASGEFSDMGAQNMFFTLALALLTIWAIDELRKRIKITALMVILTIVITLGSGYLAALLALDYTYYGIFIPVIFYLLKNWRLPASILGFLVIITEIWSFIGFFLVNLYNGKRGRFNKWIGYIFYPAHLLIIGLFRMYIL